MHRYICPLTRLNAFLQLSVAVNEDGTSALVLLNNGTTILGGEVVSLLAFAAVALVAAAHFAPHTRTHTHTHTHTHMRTHTCADMKTGVRLAKGN